MNRINLSGDARNAMNGKRQSKISSGLQIIQVKMQSRYTDGFLAFFVSCLILLFSPNFLPKLTAQEADSNLRQILVVYEVDEIRPRVEYLAEKYKGMAFASYLDALTETDATQACEKYIQLFTKYPDSKYAPLALFKTGQYYFARGLYVSSRKYFLQLIENMPESDFVDQATYYAASCLFAMRNYESCQAELRNFLARYPRSSLRSIAKEDLAEIRAKTNGRVSDRDERIYERNGNFTLQVGAFSSRQNAVRMKDYLENVGLPTEIHERKDAEPVLFLVWVGSFENRSDAERFAEEFKREHGKPYRIVARK